MKATLAVLSSKKVELIIHSIDPSLNMLNHEIIRSIDTTNLDVLSVTFY